jgi:hypothetical protein
MNSKTSELFELEMVKHFSTELSIRVSKHGEDSSAVWLPFSEIEVEPKGGRRVLITMPAWLAEKKGLA